MQPVGCGNIWLGERFEATFRKDAFAPIEQHTQETTHISRIRADRSIGGVALQPGGWRQQPPTRQWAVVVERVIPNCKAIACVVGDDRICGVHPKRVEDVIFKNLWLYPARAFLVRPIPATCSRCWNNENIFLAASRFRSLLKPKPRIALLYGSLFHE